MSSRRNQINELRIRATGLTRDEARRLGEAVAKQLSEVPLTGSQSRDIEKLTIRTNQPENRSITGMAGQIVSRIRNQIG